MKRFLSKLAFSSFIVLLFSPLTIFSAFADSNSVQLCPTGGPFNGVCNKSANDLIGPLINIIFAIAIIIALFFLLWGGVNWILSQGVPDKVKNARNMIIAALIGLIIVFLSFFFLNFVIKFLFGDTATNIIANVTENGIFNSGSNSGSGGGACVASGGPCGINATCCSGLQCKPTFGGGTTCQQ